MLRSFLASCTVLLGLLTSIPASAARPTVAILGLEVIDDGAGIEPRTTQFAKELTEELRKRPKAGTGPYSLAPGSDKDLLELKLLSGCESEGKDCMAAIGVDLATDRLLYGKVEKRANGYQVSLKLLNVGTRAFERSISDIIPFGEATGASLTSWGKKLYTRLTGVSDQGTLVVKADVDRGTVYVDGQVKGTLAKGTARVAGLSEGSYQLAIEAEGRPRYEATVTVGPGGETVHEATLGPAGAGSGPGGTGPGGSIFTGSVSSDQRPGGGYRALFWTSLVLTAGSATGVTVFGLKVIGPDEEAKKDAITAWQEDTGMELNLDNACQDARDRLSGGSQNVPSPMLLRGVRAACDRGQRDALITNVFIGATAVSAVATVFFYYKGYVAAQPNRESVNRTMTRRAPGTPTITFVPAVGPTAITAGMRITF
jgi:hypothetical protein